MVRFVVILGLILSLCRITYSIERASGVGYIGRGYDIVDGNPNGVPLGSPPPPSASDPGMKAYNWLELTYDQKRTDVLGRVSIPDQLSYSAENSCLDMKSSSVITNNKQYQEKLSNSVSMSASAGFGFAKVAFSGSMKSSTETAGSIKSKKVYLEENVLCSYGNAIYRFGNEKKYLRLTDDAMRLVCRLPTYMSQQYYELISNLGTHYIKEATLGSKKVHRKETVMSSFFESVLQTSGVSSGVSASYMGYGGSLGVSVDSSSMSESSNSYFGSEELTWNMGSKEYNSPTKMKIEPITELLSKEKGFWDVACTEEKTRWGDCCNKLDTISSIMTEALKTYPTEYRHVNPVEAKPITFQLVWPEGTYALYAVNNRCPKGHSFTWSKGKVFQDTDDWNEANEWSSKVGWSGFQLSDSSITQAFCVKGRDGANDYELQWPKGDYCINKYMRCPAGFKEGFIKWDDENVYNKNYQSGSIPDGVYEKDTTLKYCCRKDGSPLESIRLPSTNEFYLVRRGTQCQSVHNTNIRTDWVEWSLESWWGISTSDMKGGDLFPYVTIRSEKLRMYFCHYTPIKVTENETITLNIQ